MGHGIQIWNLFLKLMKSSLVPPSLPNTLIERKANTSQTIKNQIYILKICKKHLNNNIKVVIFRVILHIMAVKSS